MPLQRFDNVQSVSSTHCYNYAKLWQLMTTQPKGNAIKGDALSTIMSTTWSPASVESTLLDSLQTMDMTANAKAVDALTRGSSTVTPIMAS